MLSQSLLIVSALVGVALSYPIHQTPATSQRAQARDGDISDLGVTTLSNSSVEVFHQHALLAQAAYCDDATAALPQVDMITIGGDGGTIPRCAFTGTKASTLRSTDPWCFSNSLRWVRLVNKRRRPRPRRNNFVQSRLHIQRCRVRTRSFEYDIVPSGGW